MLFPNRILLSQCTFWCSVLSDVKASSPSSRSSRSQCTFWCSVLSDVAVRFADGGVSVSSQCTFWCSVLSDSELLPEVDWELIKSQCTFWRSVLSDAGVVAPFIIAVLKSQCTFWSQCFPTMDRHYSLGRFSEGLNAPSGAQCFPTLRRRRRVHHRRQVSMHLLVLSAFRHGNERCPWPRPSGSQCTFWCSVLSDREALLADAEFHCVSMHLLVLSAFRLFRCRV